MIKAVLVDDEKPALRVLEHLLKAYPEISIAGMYTNPLKAVEEIGRLKPEAVFLDINMPQLRGIDAASMILDASPGTDIVFVTAYDQYAIEAFELNALDYLLKPTTEDRLKKTVERLMKRKPAPRESGAQRLRIKCLGRFQVAWEDREPIKWRAEKNRELFAFLLHNHGRAISKEELLDRLWPDDNPEKAVRQLYNGIYHIRKALEEYGVDRNRIAIDSNYHLKLGPVDYDIRRFLELEKSDPAGSLEALEEMDALYDGDYLEGEDFPWADLERERLIRLHLQCQIKLSKRYIERKQFDKAESILEKAYHKSPYEEAVTEYLLGLYMEKGEKSKAVRHYNAYAKLLEDELGIKPDGRLKDIFLSAK